MTTVGGNRNGVLTGRGDKGDGGDAGNGANSCRWKNWWRRGNVTTTEQAKKQQGNIALFSQAMDAGRLRWAILSDFASWRGCYKTCLKCKREHKMIWQQCRLHQFQPCNDCPIIDPPLKEFLHWPHLVDTRHTWCHYHLNQSINWGNDKFWVKIIHLNSIRHSKAI